MANRLNLDWSLITTNERSSFVNSYIMQTQFTKNPLTEDELETIANYVLWGKDEDGTSVVQRKEIELETRNATWTRKAPESLDALLETPTFNENTIAQNDAPRAKNVRIVFDREKALRECPPPLVSVFTDLFTQIDQLDLIINYYDLAHGKRKNPPRPELLAAFSEADQLKYRTKADSLSQYRYLKLRHLLVELRKQQFTLRDTYTTPIQLETTNRVPVEAPSPLTFDADIIVLPCGVASTHPTQKLVFSPMDELLPSNLTQIQLNQITKTYWERKDNAKQLRRTNIFDFTNVEHVSNLFLQFFELSDAAALNELDSTTAALLSTLNYYTEMADLTPAQCDILELKKQGLRNQEIADRINQSHNKTYTANYISTIFRQKIVKQINEAALYHERVIQSLPYPEEFKACSTCGHLLLRDGQNFVRKSRAKDGYAGRCKRCDKADRQYKKDLQEKYNNGLK